MKLLTLNFLTCSVKTCKTNVASFPLHPRDAELEILEAEINLPFLTNILPRLMWPELRAICGEVRRSKGFLGSAPRLLGGRTARAIEDKRRKDLGSMGKEQSLTSSYSSVSLLSPKPRQRPPTSLIPPALRSTQPTLRPPQELPQSKHPARQRRTSTVYFSRHACRRASWCAGAVDTSTL
jgi:hypothetical protein